MLSDDELAFLQSRRVAHLATADADAAPHVVPVCFVATRAAIYIGIDEKPKRRPASRLKRLANIAQNASTAFVADRYDDRDWSRLGWVMVRGEAEIIQAGAEHAAAQARLRARYPQLAAMRLEGLPVIAIRIRKATHWGDISVGGAADAG